MTMHLPSHRSVANAKDNSSLCQNVMAALIIDASTPNSVEIPFQPALPVTAVFPSVRMETQNANADKVTKLALFARMAGSSSEAADTASS